MIEKIELYYINHRLQIGLSDVKHAYLLAPGFTPLITEVYKGNLVYRVKGTTKRISYKELKKDLVKKRKTIEQKVPDWL